MPVNIHCPQCRLLLQLPDQMVGKKVKCSSCQAVFTAEVQGGPGHVMPPPAPGPSYEARQDDREREPEEDEDRPRRRRRFEDEEESRLAREPAPNFAEGERDAWLGVRVGLRLHMLGQYAYAGALVLFLFVSLIAAADPRGSGFIVFLTVLFGGVGMVALLGGLVLALLAYSFFLSAPTRHGARPFATSLLVVMALVLLRAAGFVTDVGRLGDGFGDRFGFVLGGIATFMLLEIIRLTLLPIFVMAVGRNMNVLALSRHALAQAIAVPGTMLFLMLLSFVLGLVSSGGGGVGLVVVLLNAMGYIGLLVWGAILLHGAAKVVTLRTS